MQAVQYGKPGGMHFAQHHGVVLEGRRLHGSVALPKPTTVSPATSGCTAAGAAACVCVCTAFPAHLGDPVVRVHRAHPLAQALGGAAGTGRHGACDAVRMFYMGARCACVCVCGHAMPCCARRSVNGLEGWGRRGAASTVSRGPSGTLGALDVGHAATNTVPGQTASCWPPHTALV